MTAHRRETARLVLRRWRPADLAPFAAICADPAVMRWIGDGRVRSRQDCAAAVQRFETDWGERGFGLFALELRESGGLIGFAGLSVPTFLPEVLPAVEIGWRLARAQWGRGYAGEAGREILSVAFDDLALGRVIGIHQVGNHASERLLQKLGMRFERETVDPSCQRPVRVYEARAAPPA